MTNREAILKAIRQDPESDHLRLVLADACDDEGLSLYAEFVRKQVEFSRMPPDRRSPAREVLRQQIRDLWQEGEVVRHAIPDSVSCADVGVEMGPGVRGVVERGLLSTLLISSLEDEDWYYRVCEEAPVQRLILRGIREWYNLRNRIDNYFPKWVQIDTRVGPGATMLSELSDKALERRLGLTEVGSLTQDWSYIYTVEARRRAKRNELKKS